MERPIPMPIGTDLNDLDTPSLYLDKNVFVENCKIFSQEFSKYHLTLRPDVSLYRSSELARLHLEQFPKINSVHTGTLSEASILTNMGLNDIMVGTLFPLDQRLNILADINARANVSIPIGTEHNIDVIEEFSAGNGVTTKVIIPLTTDASTLGIFDYQKASDIAVYMQGKRSIEFEGFIMEIPPSSKREVVDEKLADIKNVVADLALKGINSKKISVITGNFSLIENLDLPLKIEIVDSTLIFGCGVSQESPVGVISSVMSHPQSDMAYLDCGQKSISIDRGLPEPFGRGLSSLVQMSAEHGYLRISESGWTPKLGDKVKLNPADVGDTFNLYDYLNVIYNGVLETVYKIDGRGCYV